MKRPTIKDVARESGYSIATVSLVINNKKVKISKSTKEKVWKAVEKLNYRPNQLAVSMITKKTKIIGLIIPDNTNMFFAELSKEIEMAARKSGYNLIYGNSNNKAKNDIDYITMFIDRQVDGIIVARSASSFGNKGEKAYEIVPELIEAARIPVVTIDRIIPGSNSCAVLLNHLKGGYLATKHLIDLGHTKIGCYTGPNELTSSKERLEGYKLALKEAEIPFLESLIFEGNFQNGQKADAYAYLTEKKVTAIFAFNDIMALGLYKQAKRKGHRIPEDLSIVGFDNIPFSDMLQPPLTTISQPIKEMGSTAIKIIIKAIENQKTFKADNKFYFEPVLVKRSSTRKNEE